MATTLAINLSQKLREMISGNSTDYYSWRSLISEIETSCQDDENLISLAYDHFLPKFPLCHWHLEKYAYHRLKFCGAQEAVKIFEQGARVAMFSVGFWVDYFTFCTACFSNPEDVRRLFARASSYLGKDYFCHILWDKYMKYEFNQQGWHFLARSYIQVLRFPTKKLHFYHDNFLQFVANLEEEMDYKKNHNVGVEHQTNFCSIKISRDEIYLLINDLLDSSDISIKCNALDRYRHIGEEFYQESCLLNEKIKLFEANIRRRFFCVTPLDEDQLNNWHLYLDFVEKQENLDWAMKLYERCLIPCANYPEFWMRYVDYLESRRGCELSISALDRATQIFLKDVPEIHLFSARFKEHTGDVNGARDSLCQCYAKNDSCVLEKVITQAGMEKRLGNLAEASALYEEALRTATLKQKTHILPKLYSQYAWLIFMTTGNAVAARDVLINAIKKVPNCRFLFEELIKFAMTHVADQIDIIDSIIDDAICSASAEHDGMNVKDRETISFLFIEFANLCGTVHDIRKAWNRHAKLFPKRVRSGATYEGSREASSLKMARGQNGSPNPVVHDQPSPKQLFAQPMPFEIQGGSVEFSVDRSIQANQVMEKESPLEACNCKDKETAFTLSTEVVVSSMNLSPNDESGNVLSHQFTENKQESVDVTAILDNQFKGKPGPMNILSEHKNKSERRAINISESSSIELCMPSGTTEPIEVSGGSSAVKDIDSELDHEAIQQKQTIPLDNTNLLSEEKQYQELVPMSCDEYQTNGRVSAAGECTSQCLAIPYYNSLPCPNGHETVDSPPYRNASGRDGSVCQQDDARTSKHSNPTNEPASSVLMNECNAELDSTAEDNSQVQPEKTNHVFSASMMTHLSTVSTTQSPALSSHLMSYPQSSMPQSTIVSTQHQSLAYQDLTTNQWMQYYYHQQNLMQQQFQQQQQHVQQSFLQLQNQYINQQQLQLQPQQHVHPQQYYVHDQNQPTQQQISSFQPFHQQIPQYQEQNRPVDHQKLQQDHQHQELVYHTNQLEFQQNAAAQGQPVNLSQYQPYEQGHLQKQQSRKEIFQEHSHQHSDQKQQN